MAYCSWNQRLNVYLLPTSRTGIRSSGNMTVYDGMPESDLLLLDWWTRMAATMELEQAFSVVHASVGSFFHSFRPPAVLVYELDDEGIWFAAWFDPVMSGAFYGLWIAPQMRLTMCALRAVQKSVAFGLEKFPVLIGATRQTKVARQAARFGARIVGDIPNLFDGEKATICYITRETVREPRFANNPSEVSNG
jgi:hypothetical protein